MEFSFQDTSVGSSISLNDPKCGVIGDVEEYYAFREPTCTLRKLLPSPRPGVMRRQVLTARCDFQDNPGSPSHGANRNDTKSPVSRRRMCHLDRARPPTSPALHLMQRICSSSTRARPHTTCMPVSMMHRLKSPSHLKGTSPQGRTPKSRRRRRSHRRGSRRRASRRRRGGRTQISQSRRSAHLSSAEDDSLSLSSPHWIQGAFFAQRPSMLDCYLNEEEPPSNVLPGGRVAKTIPLLPPDSIRASPPSRPLRLLQDVTSTLATGNSSLSLTSNSSQLSGSKPRATQWPSASSKRNNSGRLGSGPNGSANRDLPPCSRRRPRRNANVQPGVPLELLPSPHRHNITLPRLLLDALTVPARFDREREKIMGTRNYLRLFFPQKWQENEMQKHYLSKSRPRNLHHSPRRDPVTHTTAPNDVPAELSPSQKTAPPPATKPSTPPVVPRLQKFPQMTRRCRLTSNITLAQYISNVMGFLRDSYYRSADDENAAATEYNCT